MHKEQNMSDRQSGKDAMEYWKEYYAFWDEQIKDWFTCREKNGESKLLGEFSQYVQGLDVDDMPEPYYGLPDKGIKAVVLHHNPGVSEQDSQRNTCDESQKRYSLIDGAGWLIRKFRDNCGCSYHKFVKDYSCFIPRYRSENPVVDGQGEREICGVKWWQGLQEKTIGGEIKWLGQIYGKNINPDDKPDRERLHPLEVFALEFCPFHSSDFRVRNENFFYGNMKGFVVERIFKPAICAVRENNLPFAVARGSKFREFMQAMDLQHEKEWSYTGNISEWPTNENGNMINRTYRLYKIDDGEGKCARVLLTWYSGGYNPPSDKFKEVERQIREYVANNPLT